ncbi:12362_t:CDS:1, partial [Gigaspora margarita]
LCLNLDLTKNLITILEFMKAAIIIKSRYKLLNPDPDITIVALRRNPPIFAKENTSPKSQHYTKIGPLIE